MNKCTFQLWEESSRDEQILDDGCSLHLNELECQFYIQNIYNLRGSEIPQKYERIVGKSIEAFISDNLFENLKLKKNIRLSEIEKNNLILLEEILFKPNI